jgi:hypothetical protein
MIDSRGCVLATVGGTVLQLAMVFAGHSNASIAQMFAVGGMGISLLAGAAYAAVARSASSADAAIGGAIAGGVCALIGICVSYLLGDVSMSVLILGAASSAVTGAIGGWVCRTLWSRRSDRASA